MAAGQNQWGHKKPSKQYPANPEEYVTIFHTIAFEKSAKLLKEDDASRHCGVGREVVKIFVCGEFGIIALDRERPSLYICFRMF
jgi:hypothetical protein